MEHDGIDGIDGILLFGQVFCLFLGGTNQVFVRNM